MLVNSYSLYRTAWKEAKYFNGIDKGLPRYRELPMDSFFLLIQFQNFVIVSNNHYSMQLNMQNAQCIDSSTNIMYSYGVTWNVYCI